MRFSVLSSGSKANSTFVEAAGMRLLIDCGLSGKQAEARMAEVGVDPASIDAILVTHEHADHIHGVGTLSRRYNIPVYANAATMEFILTHWCGVTNSSAFSNPASFSLRLTTTQLPLTNGFPPC